MACCAMVAIGCSDDDPSNSLFSSNSLTTNTNTNPNTLNNNSVTLSWTEPTVYIDGSALTPGAIKKYRIYLSSDQSTFSSYIEIESATNPNSYTIDYQSNQITDTSTVFIAMTAVDDNGIESDFSEIIDFIPK